jgi:hypothetical protein
MAYTDDSSFEGVTRERLEHMKAISAVRWLSALHAGKGERTSANAAFLGRWPGDLCASIIERSKAPIGAGTFTTTPAPMAEAFVAAAQPFTLIGRLALRRVPFNVPITHGAPSASFAWVGAGMVKPAVALSYAPGDALPPTKASGIVVLTAELLRLHARAEEIVLGDLRRAYASWIDSQFVDPDIAAVPDENPGSITNGLSPIPSAGSTPDDAREDLRRLHALYVSGGGRVESAVVLMSSANAVALALTGHEAFRGLTRDGGVVGGLPVVASESVGYQVVMVDTSQVLLADDGEADLNVATHASVEMLDSALQQDGTTGTGASLVSLWQSDLAGIRIERTIHWRAAEGAVQRVEGALYYSAGSPIV